MSGSTSLPDLRPGDRSQQLLPSPFPEEHLTGKGARGDLNVSDHALQQLRGLGILAAFNQDLGQGVRRLWLSPSLHVSPPVLQFGIAFTKCV